MESLIQANSTFSANGKFVVDTSSDILIIRETQKLKEVHTFQLEVSPRSVCGCAWDPISDEDREQRLVLYTNHVIWIIIFNLETGSRSITCTASDLALHSVEFCSVRHRGKVIVRLAVTLVEPFSTSVWAEDISECSLMFPKSSFLAYNDDKSKVMWHLEDSVCVTFFSGSTPFMTRKSPFPEISHIAGHPHADIVALASSNGLAMLDSHSVLQKSTDFRVYKLCWVMICVVNNQEDESYHSPGSEKVTLDSATNGYSGSDVSSRSSMSNYRSRSGSMADFSRTSSIDDQEHVLFAVSENHLCIYNQFLKYESAISCRVNTMVWEVSRDTGQLYLSNGKQPIIILPNCTIVPCRGLPFLAIHQATDRASVLLVLQVTSTGLKIILAVKAASIKVPVFENGHLLAPAGESAPNSVFHWSLREDTPRILTSQYPVRHACFVEGSGIITSSHFGVDVIQV